MNLYVECCSKLHIKPNSDIDIEQNIYIIFSAPKALTENCEHLLPFGDGIEIGICKNQGLTSGKIYKEADRPHKCASDLRDMQPVIIKGGGDENQ